VTRILVGDVLLGSAIILGVVGVTLCIWHAGKDFRWFRKACVYPITAIHVAPWGYYTEGEPICRLYRSDAPMGGKTGTTAQAGNCLSSAYKWKDNTYIIVVFDAGDRFKATKNLIKYVKKYA
jgi:hypothetical protein